VLGYRHLFHAGNFADVLKHVALALIARALARKPKPFFFLDTHAGAGRYDLTSPQARTHSEFRDGIGRIWGSAASAPPAVAPYLEAVRAINPACAGGRAALRAYPGSPRVVRAVMRPGDRMALCELHPADHARLAREFAGDPQVGVHRRDGYEALKAFLPPPEGRGLVLLDPPYEQTEDWQRVADGLVLARRRWPGGVIAAWYPIRADGRPAGLHARVLAAGLRKVLRAEMEVFPADTPGGLNGSGLLVVNPPWRLDEALGQTLPWLHQRLSPAGAGGWRVEWLAPE
jgi:23S rRNA (adenine2030-N6)-methyltransferase